MEHLCGPEDSGRRIAGGCRCARGQRCAASCRSGLQALSLARLDPCDACRGSEDARAPVVPSDAEARRILGQNLLDDSCPTGLSSPLRLDDDPVSHTNVHGFSPPAIRSRQPKASAGRPILITTAWPSSEASSQTHRSAGRAVRTSPSPPRAARWARQKSTGAALPVARLLTADRGRRSPHTGSCVHEQERVLAVQLPEGRRACRSRRYCSLPRRRLAGWSGATGHRRNSAGSSPSPGATECSRATARTSGGWITSATSGTPTTPDEIIVRSRRLLAVLRFSAVDVRQRDKYGCRARHPHRVKAGGVATRP